MSSSYTQGHDEAVVRNHAARTALNSIAYLLPHVKPSHHILDVGCGPGSISLDLADLVPSGSIIAIDNSADVIEQAKKAQSARGTKNIEFSTGDAFHLPYEDDKFDIVHMHQLLIHLPNPVEAMKEFRRVLKPGGILACKEGDMSCSMVYPESYSAPIQEFHNLFCTIVRSTSAYPDAGRRLHAWAREAGFPRSNITAGASVFCYGDEMKRRYWAQLWIDRCEKSSWGKKAVEGGFVSGEELEGFVAMWKRFAEEEDGWLTLMAGEVICTKE